jgi:hypothetical protein
MLYATESYQQTDLVEALRVVEPRLRWIDPIPFADGTQLYGDIGLARKLPVGLMGDDLARLASLLLRLVMVRHGVLLIDEIENGFHHSVMRTVWSALGTAAQRCEVQVFAATHSWECIQAAHEAFATSEPYDLRFHRLERVGDRIIAVTFDQNMLETAAATDLEVR